MQAQKLPISDHGAVKLVLSALFALGLGLHGPSAAWAEAGECGGVRMPKQIEVEGETLALNGMGIRRATLLKVNVYVAALYVPEISKNASELLRPDQLKSLTLHFVRDVSRQDMSEALRDGVRDNAKKPITELSSSMRQLERMLPELKKGDDLTFRHEPGHGLSVFAEQKHIGTIADEDFALTLFRVWLGPKPPDEGLRKGLLGGACA